MRPRLRVVQLVKTKVPKIEVEELTVAEREEAWFVEVVGRGLRRHRARRLPAESLVDVPPVRVSAGVPWSRGDEAAA